MNRSLASSDEIIFGQSEAVVKIPQEEVGVWALEISLLLLGLSDSLTVRHFNDSALLLSLHTDKQLKRAVVSHLGTNEPGFSLARTQAEYLQAVLLRTYRDGMAEGDHVHIEGGFVETAYDLTLFFGASQPPLSAKEAAQRMDD